MSVAPTVIASAVFAGLVRKASVLELPYELVNTSCGFKDLTTYSSHSAVYTSLDELQMS